MISNGMFINGNFLDVNCLSIGFKICSHTELAQQISQLFSMFMFPCQLLKRVKTFFVVVVEKGKCMK
jgi:hypothetical protein